MTELTPRKQYLEWAKGRALECLATGDVRSAFTSLASDLSQNPETSAEHIVTQRIGLPQLLSGQLSSVEQMRRFIEGF